MKSTNNSSGDEKDIEELCILAGVGVKGKTLLLLSLQLVPGNNLIEG